MDGGVIRDQGGRISVENMSDHRLETALSMSQVRFGKLLNIEDSDKFKARVTQVVVRFGLDVEFLSPTMETARKALAHGAGKEGGLDKPGKEHKMDKVEEKELQQEKGLEP